MFYPNPAKSSRQRAVERIRRDAQNSDKLPSKYLKELKSRVNYMHYNEDETVKTERN
jgi:hypothetical protein